MMRVLHLERLFPEFNGDDDTPFVSRGIVHVLDTFIIRSSPVRMNIFSPYPVTLLTPQPLIPEPDQRVAEPDSFLAV